MLTASYRRLEDLQERRLVGAICLALVIFGVIVVHNFFTRNWTSWFGSAPPALFSGDDLRRRSCLFQFVPLTLAYGVLTEGRAGPDRQA